MKLGIYKRVSSDEQKKHSNSFDSQLKRGIEVCEMYGYSYEEYEEEALSGTLPLSELPTLTRLLNDLKSKRIDGLTVSKFDRLSRNPRNWIDIRDVLLDLKCLFYISGTKIDLTDANVDFQIDLLVGLAKLEVQQLKHRVNQGLKTGIEKGRIGGGGFQAFGYMEGDNKMLVVDPDEAVIVSEIFDLSLRGSGIKKLAKILNERGIETKFQKSGISQTYKGRVRNNFIWKSGTVYKMLVNPIYKGDRRFRGEVYHSEDLRIVSDVLFDTVQDELTKRKIYKNTNNKYTYILKGKLVCKKCGSPMRGEVRPDRKLDIYRCDSKRTGIGNCGSRSFNKPKLEQYVLDQLILLPKIAERAYQFHKIAKWSTKQYQDLLMIPVKVKKLEGKKMEMLLLDVPKEDKESAVKELNKQISDLTKEEKRLGVVRDYYDNQKSFIYNITQLVKPLKRKNLSDKNKEDIVRSLVDKIEVEYIKGDNNIGNHNVKIHFKIDNSSNLKLSTIFGVDSRNYSKISNTVDIEYTDINKLAHLKIDVDGDIELKTNKH